MSDIHKIVSLCPSVKYRYTPTNNGNKNEILHRIIPSLPHAAGIMLLGLEMSYLNDKVGGKAVGGGS